MLQEVKWKITTMEYGMVKKSRQWVVLSCISMILPLSYHQSISHCMVEEKERRRDEQIAWLTE